MRHFIACCVLIAVLSSVSAYTCPPTLKSGLMELFDEMNGAIWTNSSNWLTGDPCVDQWFGVKCTPNGDITDLVLPDNLVRATRLPDVLGCFDQLKIIQLERNQITGELPGSLLSTMAKNVQHLILSHNHIKGPIPAEIGLLDHLQYLELDHNHLNGTLPPELCQASNLTSVDLSSNHFEGDLPPCLSSGLDYLEEFRVHCNNLTGEIPDMTGNTKLHQIEVQCNEWTDPCPEWASSTGLMDCSPAECTDCNERSGCVPAVLDPRCPECVYLRSW